MTLEKRIMSRELLDDEVTVDRSLRPRTLEFFTGQRQICENLSVFIKAALSRFEALDHVLLSGPPGLGKTTLAQIIAHEMGANIKVTSGPVLTKPGDLAALLTNMNERDVLFIDEIHRIQPAVEEILYPAMEDFKIDILIGEGQSARSIRLDTPQFTLVAATTRLGLLSQPLRERFGIPFRFEFYSIEELSYIIQRNAEIMEIAVDDSAAVEIAKRSRGTPRIAFRLLRRVRDFATVATGTPFVTAKIAAESLDRINVDPFGLDSEDKKYLSCIKDLFAGGPVGIDTLAAALSETANTIEDVIEPYLIQQGLIQKTPRGRIVTERGHNYE
jgi:Holliday junction DNA helicase RuvB